MQKYHKCKNIKTVANICFTLEITHISKEKLEIFLKRKKEEKQMTSTSLKKGECITIILLKINPTSKQRYVI